MKKIVVVLMSVFVLGGALLSASSEKSNLYKYEMVNGTLQYSQNQVPMSIFAPDYGQEIEYVQIPNEYEAKKFEFRSAWVATVFNLHMPKTTSEENFKVAYEKILNNYEAMSMNTVIFQVRPELDAFYPSSINPWSRYMSANQGVDPGWDPLAYMIEATHARGLEYHAWFNPFRVNASPYDSATMLNLLGKTEAELKAMPPADIVRLMHQKGYLADNNYAVLHPEHTLKYASKIILDPGIPEVRQHIVESINEVIQKYDVDAIHFDDYFYPYKSGTTLFGDLNEDRHTFETYGLTNGYEDTVDGLEAWRRDNVTSLVRELSQLIRQNNQETGKLVQFGISPFGIWAHKDQDENGSLTSSAKASSSYKKSIFADSRLWIKEELVDYIVPQVYWAFNTDIAPYGEITRWWSDTVEGTNVSLYIGHANYKYGTNDDWKNFEEIPNQLRFNQDYNVDGSSFYSFNETVYVEGSTTYKDKSLEVIKEYYGRFKSLPAAKRTLDNVLPDAPTNVKFHEDGSVTWQASTSSDESKYIVYRQDKATFTTIEDMVNTTKNIVEIVDTNESKTFTYTPTTFAAGDYVYAVSTVDRAYNESAPLKAVEQIDVPTQTHEVVDSTLTIRGTAKPNYNVVIELLSGQKITVPVASDGTYQATIGLVGDSDTVTIYVENPTTFEASDVVQFQVEKQIEVVAKPTVTTTIVGNTLTVGGEATPNFDVVITLGSGQTKTVRANADGLYETTFDFALNQDVVTVFVKNPTTLAISEPVAVLVEKDVTPEVVTKPTLNATITDNVLTVSGEATPNFDVVITLGSGQTKTVRVGADGLYQATFDFTQDRDVVTAFAKNPTTLAISEPTTLMVTKPAPEVIAKPTVTTSVEGNVVTVKGTATPNYDVVITMSDVQPTNATMAIQAASLGQTQTIKANANGTFETTFELTKDKASLSVYVQNPTTKVVSETVVVTVEKQTTPEVITTPTATYTLVDQVLTIKGAATPNYEVVITLASGQTKTVVADANGQYVVTFDFTLEKDTATIYVQNPTSKVISQSIAVTIEKQATTPTDNKKLPETGQTSMMTIMGASLMMMGATVVFKKRKR